MKFDSIAARVFLGIVTIVLILCGIVGVNMSQHMSINQYSKQSFNQDVPATQISLNIKYQLAKALEALRAWSSLGAYIHRQDFAEAWQQIEVLQNQLALLTKNDPAISEQTQTLSTLLNQLHLAELSVLDVAQTPENFPGLQLLKVEAEPKIKRLLAIATELIELQADKQVSEQSIAALKQMADFRDSITTVISSLRIYLLTSNDAYRLQFQAHWHKNELALKQLKALGTSLTERQVNMLSELETYRSKFADVPDKLFILRMSEDWDRAQMSLDTQVAELSLEIASLIDGIFIDREQRMVQNLNKIEGSQAQALELSVLSLIIAIAISLLIAVFLTRMIARPIEQVLSIANSISRGKFDVDTHIKGAYEVKLLSQSLANMVEMLRQVALHSKEVANGNFERDFVIRSEEDQLGLSLQAMTENLKKSTSYNRLQDWAKTGIAEFSQILQGLTDVDRILPSVMTFTGDYLQAQIGALYLFRDEKLRLAASYAYKHRSTTSAEYKLGEGFVGQAAQEQKSLIFSRLPQEEQALQIDTGVAAFSPEHVLVCPLLNRQGDATKLVGVLVLGRERAFNDTQLEAVEKMAQQAAIAIEMAGSRSQLERLLDESQAQAEELQTQQEELRMANEEMEQQTQVLKSAQAEQVRQSEILAVNNQELKEKSHLLEQQKEALETKNIEVEKAKREVELTAQKVAQASKYKSEFLANMSHELRTPLNSLLILSETLCTNEFGNLNLEQIEDIKIIHSGGRKLLTLINDILDLAKVESGKLTVERQAIYLDELTTSIRKQFDPIAKDQGVDFELKLHSTLPDSVNTDGLRLEQILRNLLSNAFKFTEAGKVSLIVTVCDDQSVLQALSGEEGANFESALEFRVTDTGIGIESEAQQDIFEAFQQADGSTSRKFGGTGLGLTISRELAELLGGIITLSSEVGAGSTFSLFLPVAMADDVVQAPENTHLTSDYSLDTVLPEPVFVADDRDEIDEWEQDLLLIVDDDPEFVKPLIKLAHQRGFKCIATNLGKVALSYVNRFPISAVILDLGLPDFNGTKVLEGLKASPNTRHIPVHIISGSDEDAGKHQEAIGFLTKPVDVDGLNQVFNQFEQAQNKLIRRLLLLEDDKANCHALHQLFSKRNIEVESTGFGTEAIDMLQNSKFDCVVLDLTLSDMNGLQWLETCETQQVQLPPVVVYTAEELSEDKYKELREFTNSIVIKGQHGANRLYDEIALFLSSNSRASEAQVSRLSLPSDETALLQGKKVLVVDDDLRNTYALSKVLKAQGLNIVIADNGQMAVDKLAEDQDIHLILMDIMMPVMDGYEAIRQIRRRYDVNYPIIALTAKAMAEDRQHCINAGANDYITKPVESAKLVEMVKLWLYQ